MTAPSDGRPRRIVTLALLGVVATGLATRYLPDPAGDVAGDLLYAVAAYTGLVLLFPRLHPSKAAATALAWCWAVEALQATGWSAAVSRRVPAAGLLLGTGFDWRDLACYALGVATALVLDDWITTRATRRARRADLPADSETGPQ